MRFRLTPRSMTLDDIERGMSPIWNATTAKQMQIDPSAKAL